ncbi:hypothetical protein BT96DRAFT_1004200 [Gymnopus androsaceus JB14]|uniref:Uncharacterized protein n=1 Tax=Gymnopus androsaceus JB14 TaxID=1447944 RepID=A0A6A4GTB8_9AGAR|nr:hypothetical protein BT96DRAFT_1004200 [Gymnopus androsaceus JB14]
MLQQQPILHFTKFHGNCPFHSHETHPECPNSPTTSEASVTEALMVEFYLPTATLAPPTLMDSGPSNSDAALVEPNNEGNLGNRHTLSRSPTHSLNGEEDPLHPGFFIEGPRFPFDPIPLNEQANAATRTPFGSHTGTTGRNGTSGGVPPSAGFPLHANPGGQSAGTSQMAPPRTGLTVCFDQAMSGGGSDLQDRSQESSRRQRSLSPRQDKPQPD